MWNNAPMQAVQVQLYIHRATDFLEGMQLTRTDESYWNSSALLAIHSAVSYSDALRLGLGDQKLSADDHQKAADTLHTLLASRNLEDQSAFKHLRFLLKRKSLVTYGNQRLDSTDYEALFTNAERFALWARKTGRKLNLAGWHDDEQ
jgi:hypothetical protein